MYLNNFSASQLNLKHSQVRTGPRQPQGFAAPLT